MIIKYLGIQSVEDVSKFILIRGGLTFKWICGVREEFGEEW